MYREIFEVVAGGIKECSILIGLDEKFADLLLYFSEFLLTVVLVVPVALLVLLTVTILLLHYNHIRRLHLHCLRLLF